jgi:hypothetical protein
MLYIRKAIIANPYVRKFFRQYPSKHSLHQKPRVKWPQAVSFVVTKIPYTRIF